MQFPMMNTAERLTAVIAPDPETRRYVSLAIRDFTTIREHPGMMAARRFDGAVPAVIFLDIHSSPEPLQAVVLKLSRRYPTAAIVVMGGVGDLKHILEALKTGAISFLVWPFTTEEIAATWEEAEEYHSCCELRNSRLGQETW